MNFRNTIYLFGLSLAMLWLFGFMLAYKKTVFEDNSMLPSFKDADVDELTVTVRGKDSDKEKEKQDQDKDKKFAFIRTDSGWKYDTGEYKIRVDRGQIMAIVDQIKRAVKNDEATTEISTSPKDTGLNNPHIEVAIKGAVTEKPAGKDPGKPGEPELEIKEKGKVTKKDWWIKIGNENTSKSWVYVIASDRPKTVLAVPKTSLSTLFLTNANSLNSLRPPGLFEMETVNKVDLKEAKKKFEAKKVDEQYWRILQPPLGLAGDAQPPKDEPDPSDPRGLKKPKTPKVETKGIRALITTIRDLKVLADSDFVPPVGKLDREAYGLEDGKETLRVQLTGADDSKSETLLIGKATEKDKFFARMLDDEGVFRLTAKQLEPLRAALDKPEELRSKNVLLAEVPKKAEIVKLSIAKKDYILSEHGDERSWQMRLPDGKSVKASKGALQEFLDALEGPGKIEKFIDVPDDQAKKRDAELGFDSPALEVDVFTEVKVKEDKDKKKDKLDKEDRKPNKDQKFALDKGPGSLLGKGDSAEVAFKAGDPKSVAPVDEKEATVKAELLEKDKKVKFTQLVEPDIDDKIAEFTVKGGKEGAEEVKIKVTVRRKPAVTLIFGKLDAKEGWPVKRVLYEKDKDKPALVNRFYLSKELAEKIIPTDVYLTFLDNALPSFNVDDLATIKIERSKEKPVEMVRSLTERWLIKGGTDENLADVDKVMFEARTLANLKARKWVKKIDASTKLADFGLDPADVTVTLIFKKTNPLAAAALAGMCGSSNGLVLNAVLDTTSYLGPIQDQKGVATVIKFGKESDLEKDKGGSFALYKAEESKNAKKDDQAALTSELLFLAPTNDITRLTKADFHDRSSVPLTQAFIDAGTVAIGPSGLLPRLPLLSRTVLNIDPTKVKEIKLDVRTRELRSFHFVRKDDDVKKDEVKKDEAKKDEAKKTPSLKGQVWTNESKPKLEDFTLDSEKVNELVMKFATLQAKSYVAGPRPFQKLDSKEVMKLEFKVESVESGQKVTRKITLTVGAPFAPGQGYFAQVSDWPPVFIIDAREVDQLLRGTAYFGKEDLASAP